MHSNDACERETCASQTSASPLAGERPTVTPPSDSETRRWMPSPSRSSTNGDWERSAASRSCNSLGVDA